MSIPCREKGHIPHIWPYLPLEKDHMIYACEQHCQWCPEAPENMKRWTTASNLRKHAKCHILKDSPFTIQSAGKGGGQHIAIKSLLYDTQSLHLTRVREAAPSAAASDQPSTSEQLVTSLESPSPDSSLLASLTPRREKIVDGDSLTAAASPTPVSVSDPLTAGRRASVEITSPAATSPSPSSYYASSTSPTPVPEREPIVRESSYSDFLSGDWLPTAPLLEGPGRETLQSHDQQVASNETSSPSQGTLRGRQIVQPSSYDTQISPSGGGQTKFQETTSDRLVPSRRTRSVTSSPVSTRRYKRAK